MRVTVIVGNQRADYVKRRSLLHEAKREERAAIKKHMDFVTGMAEAARDAGDQQAYEAMMLHVSEHQMKLNEH